MNLFGLLLIAFADAMDSFAVSVCKGLGVQTPKPKHYVSVGLWFGGFQGLMTAIGGLIGAAFASYVTKYDHWISFTLLCILGVEMIRESFSKDADTNSHDNEFGFKPMFIMAVATSIDALAVGVSLAFVEVNIWTASLLVGIVTFLLSFAGLKIGNIFGNRYKTLAELTGGLILIGIGAKILISHLTGCTV